MVERKLKWVINFSTISLRKLNIKYGYFKWDPSFVTVSGVFYFDHSAHLLRCASANGSSIGPTRIALNKSNQAQSYKAWIEAIEDWPSKLAQARKAQSLNVYRWQIQAFLSLLVMKHFYWKANNNRYFGVKHNLLPKRTFETRIGQSVSLLYWPISTAQMLIDWHLSTCVAGKSMNFERGFFP